MTRDQYRDDAKAAFARDPRRLVQALGLSVDERKSAGHDGRDLWVYDGNESDASLQIGGPGDKAGLCHRYGDGWSGDCFALVQRVRPQDGFKTRLEFVGNLYGIEPPDQEARRSPSAPGVLAGETYYRVLDASGAVLAVHHRRDYADGTKRVHWETAEGVHELPEGLNLTDLPLWRSWEIGAKPHRPVIVTEGEKDCDALCEHGALAVGTYGADVIPSSDALQGLAGRLVYLWPDNDGAGDTHMAGVARNLHGIASRIRVVLWHDAPPKAGAADWFSAGNGVDETRALLKAAETWEPDDSTEQVTEAVNGIGYRAPEVLFRGAVPVADVAAGILERTEARRALPRKLYGMRSGWETLDWHYLGFRTEALILLTGQSGMGKTAVARHFLYASADAIMQAGLPDRLLFYALEGGKDQVLHYWAGWRYGIPWTLLQPGSERHMTDEWADLMTQAYSSFVRLPIDVCDATKDADAILFDVERRCQEGPIQGVVLDNIQELDYSCGGNIYENQKRTGRRARDIAEQYGVTFIAINQVNTGKDGWRERGGPDWGNAATTRFHVERGEKGTADNEKANSNLTILFNIKRRYGGQPCPPLRLRGNWQTGRLYEEAEEHQQAASAIAHSKSEEVDPWHSN